MEQFTYLDLLKYLFVQDIVENEYRYAKHIK